MLRAPRLLLWAVARGHEVEFEAREVGVEVVAVIVLPSFCLALQSSFSYDVTKKLYQKFYLLQV